MGALQRHDFAGHAGHGAAAAAPCCCAALRCALRCCAVLCCALPARSASPRGAGGAARPRGGARGRGLALTATRPAAEGPREAGSAALPREGKARRSGDPRASGPGRAGPGRSALGLRREGGREGGLPVRRPWVQAPSLGRGVPGARSSPRHKHLVPEGDKLLTLIQKGVSGSLGYALLSKWQKANQQTPPWSAVPVPPCRFYTYRVSAKENKTVHTLIKKSVMVSSCFQSARNATSCSLITTGYPSTKTPHEVSYINSSNHYPPHTLSV